MVPRVLTVEDEPDLRLILQDNLEFEGYEVLTAATGEEGLDLAMAKQPDLVLLDLLLPRMVNELRGNYAGYYWIQQSIVPWDDHPYPGLVYGTPIIQMRGYTIGQAHTNSHEDERQDTYGVRDNLTLSFSALGRHDLKVGGEYFYQQNPVFLCNRCMALPARGSDHR